MIRFGRFLNFWGWIKFLRDQVLLLFFAWRHPSTPKKVKAMLLALIIYLISPIDFIPDYIPVLGLVDDAALVSAAMLCLDYLLPQSVLADCRYDSRRWGRRLPYILGGAGLLAVVWAVALGVLIWRGAAN